ncbi:hypothetical protein [Fusibacter tunisiensis]|uniref:Uncharacterized protein n=1 Tax=Fusibacter tunisiensis TaxID=1008308 RepID=A0ABS2MTK7_9FIRM|nr:hypothetical protein [Fusibacter tunisiensis]MBM7562725.1 hypothetical protein [Fusibacter tunisiensis]
MNRNIDVLGKELLAVRFNLIPLMPEIELGGSVLDEINEFARLTKDGVIVLNKDHPGYEIAKRRMMKIVKMKDYEISFSINYLNEKKSDEPMRELYRTMLIFERDRRSIKKGR